MFYEIQYIIICILHNYYVLQQISTKFQNFKISKINFKIIAEPNLNIIFFCKNSILYTKIAVSQKSIGAEMKRTWDDYRISKVQSRSKTLKFILESTTPLVRL